MLIIRPEQWQALQAARERELVDRACEHLATIYPARTDALGAAALATLATDGIAAARRRGAVVESALFDYLECVLIFGRDFAYEPRHGWARRVLHDSRASASEQMAQLRERARAEAKVA
jgi:hypothetical protein